MSARPARVAPAARETATAREPAAARLSPGRHGGKPDPPAAGNLAAQQRYRAPVALPGAGAVQMQCAACAAGGAPCAKCEDEARQQVQRKAGPPGPPVQMWSCTEFDEPTCVQTRLADTPVVQARCAACDEEPVQREGDGAVAPEAVQREAGKGLAGASAPLPHAERIQAAFGHHDVSDVRAAVGGAAATASQRMGALAFASGTRIGFRETPGLHLAAHEAAHVVQQRAGLRLPGNVGRAGDAWERHADAVADAVVAGRSAQPLLDQVARPGKAGQGHGSHGANDRPGPVQHRLTTTPVRIVEPPAPPPRALADEGKAGAAGEKSGGAGAPGAPAGGEAGPTRDAAEAGDAEAPPEGVTASPGGASGGAGGAAAAPPGAGARPAAPSAGGALEAPCYNVDPPPRPDKTEKPKQDSEANKPKGEERVTFDAWTDEPDQCQAEAAMAQAGGGAGPAAGASAAGPAAPAAPAAAAGAKPAQAGAAGGKTQAKPGGPAGAAAAEGGEAAPDAGMDGAIGQAEGQRDTAIGEYEQAAAALDTVKADAGSLRSGLDFGPESGGNAAAREAAIVQTGAFLDGAADQIAEAAAFGLQGMPGRLGSLADSVNANIGAAIELEKAAVSERIAQSRVRAMGAAQAARAHVLAEHAASVTMVETETDLALAALDDEYGVSIDQTDAQETAGLADVNSRFAAGRRRHEDKGPHYAGRAVRRGQEHAHAYERCKTHPKTGVAYDDDGFWDGCLTVRRAHAQQETACKTAGSYRNAFLRTANKKGYDLRPLRAQYRCAVIAGARQVNATLDSVYDRLTAGLESGRTQAIAGLGLARDQTMAAIDSALAASLAGLSAQEASQRQAVADTGYLKQLAVEQLAHSGAANLIRGVSAASTSLRQVLGTVRDSLAGGGIPDPDWLTLTLGTLQTALGGGMGTLLGKMEEGAQGAERALVDLGMASLAALQGITESNAAQAAQAEGAFAAQMKGSMAGATDVFARLTTAHVDQARDSAAQGCDAMTAAVTGFANALNTIGERVDAAITTSLTELVADLDRKIGELDDQIAREAWKAASKEQPAWKKVAAIVLIILVIIAAAVISIVTLGAGASLFAVILVGALVGAVSAGLIQILNNWASGETWHEGLVTAMVMGAIGGAIGGGLGFAGGALASGAAAAGARVATQLAIQVGADLASEAITQTIGYFAFGQEFNWQGFLMAGAMSGVSFKAHPVAPHPAAPHPATPHPGPTPHGGTAHPAAPEAPRAHAPEAAAPRPAEASPPARAAGAAGARRAAVTQVAGGALVGFAVEGIGAWLGGQKFDMGRAASAAAGGAVSARAARMGHGGAPREEPATRLGRAGERMRQFDPGEAGARLGKRLEDVGGRLFGRPEADVPGAAARPRADEPAPRPPEDTHGKPPGPGEEAPRGKPPEADDGPRQAAAHDADTAGGPARVDEAQLAGPANRMSEADLVEATTVTSRVGDTVHDFRVTREGCEICTGCTSVKRRLDQMLESAPEGPLRERLAQLRAHAESVDARLAGGESGVAMAREAAAIAREFRALAQEHPAVKQMIDEPRLRRETVDGVTETSPHLADLPAKIVSTHTISAADFATVPKARRDKAIYILRDRLTGAVLKVGIAEAHLGRITQYANAGNKLGMDLELDIAIVQPRRGVSIQDIEVDLRARLEREGQILPWDNTGNRLGRADRGTPFVNPVSKDLMWDIDGNLVGKNSGAPRPVTRTPVPSADELARLLHQGNKNADIARIKGVSARTVRRWMKEQRRDIRRILKTL